jgi:allophanate hydrolase
VIREVVAAGKDAPPESVFAGQYRLQELKARVHRRFMEADFLLLPTTPAHFTRAAVAADPIGTNSLIGTYTNFVNLLDLSAVSVPSGFRDPGLPFGVTMVGLPYREGYLASMASAFHARRGLTLGRTGAPLPPPAGPRLPEGAVPLAVAGLHLSGQPLNGQLLDRGARLRGTYRTAPVYRLHALRRGERHFPGLVRSPEGGASVEVEVWDMTRPALGDFLGLVKAPLGLGTVELEGGLAVTGFLCESYAVEDATDITAYGGWLPYLRSLS